MIMRPTAASASALITEVIVAMIGLIIGLIVSTIVIMVLLATVVAVASSAIASSATAASGVISSLIITTAETAASIAPASAVTSSLTPTIERTLWVQEVVLALGVFRAFGPEMSLVFTAHRSIGLTFLFLVFVVSVSAVFSLVFFLAFFVRVFSVVLNLFLGDEVLQNHFTPRQERIALVQTKFIQPSIWETLKNQLCNLEFR